MVQKEKTNNYAINQSAVPFRHCNFPFGLFINISNSMICLKTKFCFCFLKKAVALIFTMYIAY